MAKVRLDKKQSRAVSAQLQSGFLALIVDTSSPPVAEWSISLPMRAMGAVRTSQKDRWEPRPVVKRYYQWRDRIRELCGVLYVKSNGIDTRWQSADKVYVHSYFATNIPGLWGLPYRESPDIDNIWKAVTDALFVSDEHIWFGASEKSWACDNYMDITVNGLIR